MTGAFMVAADIEAETPITVGAVIEKDGDYNRLEEVIKNNLELETKTMFQTDAADLWDIYLNNLPSNRQYYNCNCCKSFIQRYGNLVTIDENGKTSSVLWAAIVPRFFDVSVSKLRKAVESAKVTNVCVSSEKMFGTPKSPKGWTHLCGANPKVHKHAVKSAYQREAELTQDYILIAKTINGYDANTIETALKILKSEQFPGYEKSLGMAEWYAELHTRLSNTNSQNYRRNIIFKAIADAPLGFAHASNTMLGTLFDDIKSGKSFESCKRAWADKMHPLKYQRPTAPVSDNQIEVAEKLVTKLGVANSLKRRYALLEEVIAVGHVWTPPATFTKASSEGVFTHLRGQKTLPSAIKIPDQSITWNKFNRDVLPSVRTMQILCPDRGGYVGVTAAEDQAAPLIFQWNNQFAHYFYHQGSYAADWGLDGGSNNWRKVNAVVKAPHGNTLDHYKKFLVFVVDGCHDTRGKTAGLAIFPECLKSEFREIRAVVETHSKSGGISGVGTANGLSFSADSSVTVRVNDEATYTIDRWE